MASSHHLHCLTPDCIDVLVDELLVFIQVLLLFFHKVVHGLDDDVSDDDDCDVIEHDHDGFLSGGSADDEDDGAISGDDALVHGKNFDGDGGVQLDGEI